MTFWESFCIAFHWIGVSLFALACWAIIAFFVAMLFGRIASLSDERLSRILDEREQRDELVKNIVWKYLHQLSGWDIDDIEDDTLLVQDMKLTKDNLISIAEWIYKNFNLQISEYDLDNIIIEAFDIVRWIRNAEEEKK